MFADSFSVISIHYVARGLGASFLYTSALHHAIVPCVSTDFLFQGASAGWEMSTGQGTVAVSAGVTPATRHRLCGVSTYINYALSGLMCTPSL